MAGMPADLTPRESKAVQMLTTSPGAKFIFLAFCEAYGKRKGFNWNVIADIPKEFRDAWFDAMVEYGKYLVKE